MKARELASGSNPRVKRARKLRERHGRAKAGLFVAEGPHVVEAALEAGAAVREVFCTEGFVERHAALAARLEGSGWPLWLVSEALMGSLAATEQPQGVVAVGEQLEDAGVPPVAAGLLVLALEGVGDPGNVGTAIRSAHAAGASLVVLGRGCCDLHNPKTVRASAGGVFGVPVMAADDLGGVLRSLRSAGARVVAAEPGAARACWEEDLRGPTVLVVGSEAHGLSAEADAHADVRVRIPMPGGAESLNAATAAGVLLYEAVRQRG